MAKTRSGGKKSDSADNGDGPKKPLTAYNMFCQDHREKAKTENADKKSTEINKILSDKWKNLSAEEKKPYEDKAKADKDAYKAELAKNADESEEEETEEGSKKRKRKAPKKEKDPNAPKKPLTAYMIYLGDQRPEIKKTHPNAKAPEVAKLVAAKWKEMDPAAKKPFEDRAKTAKEEYTKKKEEYEKSAKKPKLAAEAAADDDDEEDDE